MPNKPTGTVTLVTTDPVVGGTATFHVESSDPNLFIHLKGLDVHGTVVYDGRLRWTSADVTFELDTVALDAAVPPFSFKAQLEDWSSYSKNGKITPVGNEFDFTVDK